MMHVGKNNTRSRALAFGILVLALPVWLRVKVAGPPLPPVPWGLLASPSRWSGFG